MNQPQRIVLGLAAIIMVLMVLFPPFYGIDRASAGRVHAFIGYYPIWRPPASASVYRALTSNGLINVDEARLSAFVARLNVVRFLVDFVCVAGGAALVLALLGRRRRVT